MSQQLWSYQKAFDADEVQKVLKSWSEASPEMGVFALVAESCKDSVPQLQALCKAQGVPLVGAIFPELIVNAKFEREGILLTSLSEMPDYYLGHVGNDEDQVQKLAHDISRAAEKNSCSSLFMVFDGMIPNIASILDQLYLDLADSVQYSGVSAGSETFEPMPCLFDAEQCIQNGVLALLFSKCCDPMLSHGYPIPSDQMIATSSAGNCIQSIDWVPAFEVHQKLAKEWYDTEINVDNFYEVAVHFPFGIVQASGEVLVRIPVGINADGGLYCVGEVPENAMLTVLHGKPEVLMSAVERFADTAMKNSCEGTLFYCAGRRMHLGKEGGEKELALIKAKGKLVLGALSLGEIGMSETSYYPQFHNAALVYNPWLFCEA